jgi:hypothetical protein
VVELDLEHLTSGQPFCAGVVVVERGRLLVTIAAADLETSPVWRVGGVGGGQESGETILQCAVAQLRVLGICPKTSV